MMKKLYGLATLAVAAMAMAMCVMPATAATTVSPGAASYVFTKSTDGAVQMPAASQDTMAAKKAKKVKHKTADAATSTTVASNAQSPQPAPYKEPKGGSPVKGKGGKKMGLDIGATQLPPRLQT